MDNSEGEFSFPVIEGVTFDLWKPARHWISDRISTQTYNDCTREGLENITVRTLPKTAV